MNKFRAALGKYDKLSNNGRQQDSNEVFDRIMDIFNSYLINSKEGEQQLISHRNRIIDKLKDKNMFIFFFGSTYF